LTIDRLALVVLVVAYFVQRRMGLVDAKPISGVDWLIVLFAGVLTISTFTHDWRVNTPGAVSPVWRLCFGYLMPIALYWIGRQSTIDERGLRKIYGVLAAFGLYLAFTGVAEATSQWWLVFPKYIADPEVGIHF